MKTQPLWELIERTEARTRKLLIRAERHFERPMPQTDIRFDLRGRSAGMVRFAPGRPPEIRYNLQLLAENEEKFLARTVPHEVAHLVVQQLFGPAARPHGREWKAMMAVFGADPSPYLDLPSGWSTAALAIGGFAAATAFLALLLRELGALLRAEP